MTVGTQIRRLVDRIVSNPALVLATAIAAVEAVPAGDQTWKGYGAAVGVALLRFAVKPVVDRRDRQRKTRRRRTPAASSVIPPIGPYDPK